MITSTLLRVLQRQHSADVEREEIEGEKNAKIFRLTCQTIAGCVLWVWIIQQKQLFVGELIGFSSAHDVILFGIAWDTMSI